MNKRALWKDIFREIGHTKARFISIFAIIMLGVSFFSGIKAAGPDMLDTAGTFYREQQLMDLKVQTTHGLTEDNIELLHDVPGIGEIQPGYSADVFTGDNALILKVYSYNADKPLNQYRIIEGRLPEQSGEIVLDGLLAGQYALGEQVAFSGNDTDAELSDEFRTLEYTVVGFVRSPQFIEKNNRGTSGIGKGTVDAFAAIPEADFKLPVYTEAYLSFTDTPGLKAYTPEYETLVEQHAAAVEQALSGVPEARLAELRAEGEKELSGGRAGVAAAERQLAEIKRQTEEAGQQESAAGSALAEELASAKEKLAEGEQQLAELKLPKIYVTDRNSNPGYAEYKDNADRLSAIASAFPVFFFLIAALVSLTTMTRMVEEHRLQIGTLKALGYGNRDIMAKFLVYGSLASLAASGAGLAVGFTLFPPIIYNAYSSLYNLPDIIKSFYPSYSIISVIVALVCITLTAWIASRVELRSNASVLMRPKAPKSGQRILLERVPIVWKRLSFVQKVTARNLFRYKQRMFMTVFGVAGCTALILTGFGLKDSIGSIAPQQFGSIMKYDALIALQADVPDDVLDSYEQLISGETAVTGTLEVAQEAVTARGSGVNDQDVNLFIPASVDSLDDYVELRDRTSGEGRTLADGGAIISEKLAKLYGLEPGGMLTVVDKENETFEIQVAGITENYVMHYVYMTPAYYSSVFGAEPVFNTELLDYDMQDAAWEDRFGEQLTANGRVAAVSFSSSVGTAFDDTMKSMDVVTLVLIVSAAALAFVVLYNLTNINVSERIRELSTIKVLGFYDKEVTMYIYRENILLSLLGIAAGSVLGIVLHSFVLSTAELDATMFAPVIKWPSYIYAALLTLLFSGIVMAFMHSKLKRIHMIEALKSVE
ncbi:ABC transporter permease [Paenibacillus sp. S150]|uniref:ABC transporter permease n=1 Tax=Paenibacillus sp. S150 TaxID=2749826 RepID=UPI001C564A54|nr:ABC transporter permease [Paenibacillus sp. S150]MBW4082025.1 FtsX-like permease family protein [Paenibacillus sp. S150]